MWTDSVVGIHPTPGKDFSFGQSIEYFTIQKFIPHMGIEAFTITIFPWTTWFNVGGANVQILKPVPQCDSRKLTTIITADIGRAALLRAEGWAVNHKRVAIT